MTFVLIIVTVFGLAAVAGAFYGLGYHHGVHAERAYRRQLEELKDTKTQFKPTINPL